MTTEKTIEELLEENSNLQKSVEETEAKLAALTEEKETLTKMVEEAESKTATLAEANNLLEKKIGDHKDIIKDLKTKTKTDSPGTKQEKLVVKDSDGKSHVMLTPKFSFEKKLYTFETLSNDPEAVSRMVAKKVSFIK